MSAACAHLDSVESHRVLRQLAAPARVSPCTLGGPPDRSFRRAGRRLELVLRRQRRVRGRRTVTLPAVRRFVRWC